VNLVGNAIKFTSRGTVAVEVERLTSGDLVEIRVSDTGVGIAPENLERVFEEFVTIDTAFDRENAGTGLGLAITKRLVMSMDGTIEADSLLGEGSLFTMRIPLPDAPIAPYSVPGPEIVDDTPLPEGLTALVVDDNEINRMVLTDMLKQLDLDVSEAEDGYTAIDMVKSGNFDVVFLDISMPGIDGIETLHRIRDLDTGCSDVPAIAVTAHAGQKDHEKIRQAPFEDIIVKPVQSDVLRSALVRLLSSNAAARNGQETRAGEPDFKARFGEDRYRKALQGFHEELTSLATMLEAETDPTPDLRSAAHKSAGSAAVLEETDFWTLLVALENAEAGDWDQAKDAFLEKLGAFQV
jgi:CheY-like chemotaxis protein